MKKYFLRISTCRAFVLLLALTLFANLAMAADYRQGRGGDLMPVSRGDLHASSFHWIEIETNRNISWLRSTQNLVQSMFSQGTDSRRTGGTNIISKTISDKNLAGLVTSLLNKDKTLNYNDMLSVFSEVGSDGLVSAAEYAGLQTIIAFDPVASSVQYLANALVNGNPWNSTYQGRALGNLSSGSTGTQLQNLVNKWFLGKDDPIAVDDYGNKYNYQLASGSLFVNGPSYTDIDQGYVGDCWLMASFSETALRDTSVISNMFTDNGNGTYTVQLFNNGVANYVTVDKQLPVDSKGRLVFGDFGALASNSSNELWTALAEKAAVEEYASMGYKNTYSSISGGYIGQGLSEITGHNYTIGNSLGTSNSYSGFNLAVSDWNAGQLMGFASKSSNTSLGVIAGHAYAVVAYNALTQQFTLFNPWGINNGFAPGLLTLSWSAIQSNFSYFDTALA